MHRTSHDCYLAMTFFVNSSNSLSHPSLSLSLSLSIGGMDVRDLDPQWFRKRIGIVNQEPVLFACSIRDNIAFGIEDATLEEVSKFKGQSTNIYIYIYIYICTHVHVIEMNSYF